MTAPADTLEPQLSKRETRLILAVVGLALMAVVSAVSGLNVALPSLARDTGASQTQITWIVDSYTVVFAGLLLFAGALGDRYGRRLLLSLGLIVFGGAAAFGLFVTDPDQLIIGARADGRRRSSHHAHHAVGDHHLIPGGGATAGDRRMGRYRRRRRHPGPLRHRAPAGVVPVDLVLRAERGAGGPRRSWACMAVVPSFGR